jgi:hypothetical protein
MHRLPSVYDHANDSLPQVPCQRLVFPPWLNMNQYTQQSFLLQDFICKFSVDIVSKTFFLRMLDAHDSGHEAGVPEAVFRAIFYVCGCCGRYMTKRVSLNHSLREHADSDDSGDEQAACIYRHAGTMGVSKTREDDGFRALKEFPTLEPLS